MELSNGEKLILIMLSEIYEHLKIKGDIDPQFVQKVILIDEIWSLAWQYPRIIGSSVDKTPPAVSEVVDILAMWEMLESSYERLEPADRAQVDGDAKRFSRPVQFWGFDGNNEPEHIVAADLLVNDLGRFSTFKGRDLDSHIPALDTYRKMLAVFQPLRNSPDFATLNAEQISNIIQEQTYSDFVIFLEDGHGMELDDASVSDE